MSLPILEAWIEVTILAEQILTVNSRFLYWKRGLKLHRHLLDAPNDKSLPILEAWIEVDMQIYNLKQKYVASYTGSVD